MNILYFETLTIASSNLYLDLIYVKGTATLIIQLRLPTNCSISLPSSKYKIIRNTLCNFQPHRHKNMKLQTVSYFTNYHINTSLTPSGDYFYARAANVAAFRRYVSSLTGTLVRHERFELLSPRSVQTVMF
jgi:hypothetical protein